MRLFAVFSLFSAAWAGLAVLGIDYGTDFVKSSLVAPNAPFEIVLTPDSQRKDASGLIIKPQDGERIYGSSGLNLISKFPGSALYGIKPLLGVPFDDLRVGLFQEMHPGLSLVSTERNTVAFNLSEGTVLPVEEVVAMQIQDVKTRAAAMVREKTHSKDADPRDIALSIPGNFGSAQRQALIDSLGLVNSNLIGLVSDGVAVAVNYANSPAVSSKLSADEKHYVVVYDAGASVTTSTLVSLQLKNESEVTVKVEGFGSSQTLCGSALTAVMRELLLARFAQTHGEVTRTPRLLNRMWREAERAKQVLSANTDVNVHVESLADDLDLDTKITREQFEKAVDEMDEVAAPLRESLSGTNLTYAELDAVVLAGGASRTPFILEQLRSEVGEGKLSKNVNADEANVQGTCMRGVNLSGLYRAKRSFDVVDTNTHYYEAHIKTAGEPHPEIRELFAKGVELGAKTELEIPKDITELEVYEDRKKLVGWTLPYVKQSLNSLHEPGAYTCTDKARLVAKFSLDTNGVLKLGSVEAVCNSTKSSTTTVDSTTQLSVSETSTESATESATESTGTTTTGTTTGTTGGAEPTHLKTRRIPSQADWVQGPIGASERASIRAHLSKLARNDDERKQYSISHHELESLAYRIKELVAEGKEELSQLSHRLLTWIEEGSGNFTELNQHLHHAREVFQTTTTATTATTTTAAETHDETKTNIAHDEL